MTPASNPSSTRPDTAPRSRPTFAINTPRGDAPTSPLQPSLGGVSCDSLLVELRELGEAPAMLVLGAHRRVEELAELEWEVGESD